jgi:hypothetical protein
LFALSSQALATFDGESEQRVAISDVIDSSITPILPRAVVPPTSYAPTSWYNVNHNWTAASYTYSSYFFDTDLYPYLDIAANATFRIDFYHTNGTFWGSITPSYSSSVGKYYGDYFFNPNEDYYMIIYNLSGSSITSGAWYRVGNEF